MTVFSKLYIKHRLVVSPVGASLLGARQRLSRLKHLKYPELALLREEDVLMRSVLRRLLSRNSVCVDVGAHIGSISQLFHCYAPDASHVIVEASPHKAAWLRKAFPRATVHQVAVSESIGEVSFFENLDRSGFSSLRDRHSRGRTQEIVTKCTTLDQLLTDRNRIDLIKVDVEGFEYNVFKGAQAVIDQHRPILIFEAGAAKDKDIDNEAYMALFDLLTGPLGYDLRPIFGEHWGKAPITKAEFMACRTYPFLAFNFIARPKV